MQFIFWALTRTLTCGIAAIVALALVTANLQGITLPTGFTAVPISPVMTTPVAMAFAADGRLFVAEQRGLVLVIQNKVKIATFIDLRDEVANGGDRGMIGIALDPNFMTNHFVYMLYTVDPIFGSPDEPSDTPSYGRLTRYQGTSATNGNEARLTTRRVLLGKTASSGFPACSNSHTVGAIRFAPDKSMFVGSGDGAYWGAADAGGETPGCFGPGMYSSGQDIGAFRAQYISSMAGKIVRVDRTYGRGFGSNPFYDGNPDHIKSKIWAYGLRNPYRFCVRPAPLSSPKRVYIGDVGWNSYEEINVSRGGENFGWPCYEGDLPAPEFPGLAPTHAGCDSIGKPTNPGTLTGPLISYNRSDPSLSNPQGLLGSCVTAGVFYTGTRYPEEYRNGMFFGDVLGGWIKALQVDDDDNLVEVVDLGDGASGPIDFAIDPISGDVCFLSYFDRRVYRLKYTAPGLAPMQGDLPIENSQPETLTPRHYHRACLADVAGHDGLVNIDDLMFVIEHLGSAQAEPRANIVRIGHSAGAVDLDDVLAVINAWGECR